MNRRGERSAEAEQMTPHTRRGNMSYKEQTAHWGARAASQHCNMPGPVVVVRLPRVMLARDAKCRRQRQKDEDDEEGEEEEDTKRQQTLSARCLLSGLIT